MKQVKYLFFLPVAICLFTFTSCNPSSTQDPTESSGNWVKRAECDCNARTEAVSFVIGDTAYIATGVDGSNIRYQDVWAYDQNKNFWTQRAQFPGAARNSAVAFTVGTKSYITTGYDGVNRLQDNWEYNQATNSWAAKASLPDPANAPVGSGARYDAVGFGIGNSGYVYSGFNGGYLKDIWQFTPSTNTWVSVVSNGGTKRSQGIAFVYNNKAYLFTGINNGQVTTVNDGWVFDPSQINSSTGPWTQLRNITNTSSDTYDDDYTDIVRNNAVAFVINNNGVAKGYLACGQNGGYTKKTWEYDFATDLWTRKTTYERAERGGAVAFAVKGRGFVALGSNSSYYLDDLDEFLPAATYDVND
ncbi:MAG: galactose oxidase [Bacteroidetes bacterium]|nr:galactose oxidase [Bacteroidota bacterium]MBS1639975.1 galactose oxidase [Bacteroidota bacterium]MBS1640913.1 galactose oxidase [Bacteroidota bacterium]MBS1669954.1 galactose oxidase [Bacteroidota bacterium]